MKDPLSVFSLSNGIRVVHQRNRQTQIAHVGLFIGAGTRDETPHNNGIAHFIEHAVFKGTRKRKPFHILNRMEAVGGELNAYTTRELTGFYTAGFKRYTERAIELLADLVFNPLFVEKELENERRVILEELEMYEDSPEESIFDDFFAHMFPGHPLGYNILGTRKSLTACRREDLLHFVREQYAPNRIILSVVGNVRAERICQLAEKYLGPLPAMHQHMNRSPPEPYRPFHEEKSQDFAQTHLLQGSRTVSRFDERKYALALLDNMLGGSGMSARLNMLIREKHGLSYHVGTGTDLFDDAGVFYLYLGTDARYLPKVRRLIEQEVDRICTKPVSPQMLRQAKRQLMGQFAMIEESNSTHMQVQAKHLLHYDRVIPEAEIMERLEAVTATDLMEMAQATLAPEHMSEMLYRGSAVQK